MSRLHRLALFAALLGLATLTTPAEARDFASQQQRYPRVKAAALDRLAAVAASFRDVGAAWPPRGVYIRGFKREGQVELWAAPAEPGGAWLLVRSFPVCASSGELGPKRKQGDGQVPEGFYHVSRFNPRQQLSPLAGGQLSERRRPLSQPRPRPRQRHHDPRQLRHDRLPPAAGRPDRGPLPRRDDGPRRRPADHPDPLFPCRLDEESCQEQLSALAADRPDLADFWAGLRPGYDAFTDTGVPPRVRAQRDGSYTLVRPRPGS
jgi:hypothetical protein